MLPCPAVNRSVSRDPGEGKRSHRAVPEERRRIGRIILLRDQRHPLLSVLQFHGPSLGKTNRANGFFAHYSCIAEIALHWFWQSSHVGVCNEYGLGLLVLLYHGERFILYRPGHCSFLSLSSVHLFIAHFLA
jgi:hypothetical protein